MRPHLFIYSRFVDRHPKRHTVPINMDYGLGKPNTLAFRSTVQVSHQIGIGYFSTFLVSDDETHCRILFLFAFLSQHGEYLGC